MLRSHLEQFDRGFTMFEHRSCAAPRTASPSRMGSAPFPLPSSISAIATFCGQIVSNTGEAGEDVLLEGVICPTLRRRAEEVSAPLVVLEGCAVPLLDGIRRIGEDRQFALLPRGSPRVTKRRENLCRPER